MKKVYNFLITSIIILACNTMSADVINDEKDRDFFTYQDLQKMKTVESESLSQLDADKVESVAFNFENTDLRNLADYMERVHKVKFITDEVVESKGGQKLAGNKISFRTNAPLSKQESWSLFITFLSMAGLDVIPMAHAGFYRIVPLPNAAQEAIPAYIGAHHETLPDNDMVIRYVYFMQNADPLKIHPLISKFQGSTGSLTVYKDLKALIFTDKAYNIKSLMNIVKELDKSVVPQVISVLKLKKANVEDVINLYNSLKSTPNQQQRAWSQDNKDSVAEFFSQNVVLSMDKRTNTLIIIGPKDSVARLEEFVLKYVDVDYDAKKPPVFIYYLEYTNAVDMEKTLTALVSYGGNTSAGQYGGVRDGQKYLQHMTIVADPHANALVINTSPEDYVAVESLIKELDVPQKQVAIEVLMVQVTGAKSKQLGSQIAGGTTPSTFFPNVSAQTSGVPPGSGIVTTPGGQGLAQSIKSSLAGLLGGPIGQAGSTLLTFGQPIWAVFKILKTIVSTKIIQNPFIVVTNNSKGIIKIGTSRRVVTGEAVSAGNTTATGYQTAEANLSITIVPQINEKKMISLSIAIDNNQFVNTPVNDAVQNQKSITTMATLADGEVLVLGGIMAENTSSSSNGVPFLSKIPIFGWFFKSKTQSQQKDVFVAFICPKILDNVHNEEDVKLYTKVKIDEAQMYLKLMEEVTDHSSGKDPLDKAFFGSAQQDNDDLSADRLLKRAELISAPEGPKKVSKFKKKNKIPDIKLVDDIIDMSEKKDKDSTSQRSIKNIVQLSAGAAG